MLPFSFMEIFFFLSLGITFILILLIVYHFKQRITTMEHKSDTMFDIVQNLAKEISEMKTYSQNLAQMPSSHPSAEFSGGIFMPPIFMNQSANAMEFHMQKFGIDKNDLEPVVEELDKDDESDNSDNDSDDSDDESDDNDSDDSIIFTGDDLDVELPEINKDISEIDDDNFPKIKVEDDITHITSQVIETEVSEIRTERQATLVEEELPVPEPEIVPEISSITQDNLDESTAATPQDDYKKLSMADLKKLVATKGITSKDINKLKRPDLLKLLQDA